MDNGFVTGSNGKQADGRNTILIMTSNLGASDNESNAIGFDSQEKSGEDTKAAKKFFAPEFRNRLDGTIKFDKLDKSVVSNIVHKFLKELNGQLKDKNIIINASPAVVSYLADKGYSPKLGARPLGRVIDTEIKTPLSKKVLFGDLVEGGKVQLGIESKKITFDITPLPKPLTKAEKKALKAKLKEEQDAAAEAEENKA